MSSIETKRYGRGRAHVVAVTCFIVALAGCIGNRPRRCEQHSDCLPYDSVCSTRGFCAQECTRSEDCPCGSYCAEGCGICIRSDNVGAATCFASDTGLTAAETLGVCRPSLQPASTQRQDAGVCIAPLPSLMCTDRVPRSVVTDAAAPPAPPSEPPAPPSPPPSEPSDAGGDSSAEAGG